MSWESINQVRFEPKDAKASAELFAQNSMAGVYSHGLNRFPRVVDYLKKGEIDPKVKAWKIMDLVLLSVGTDIVVSDL